MKKNEKNLLKDIEENLNISKLELSLTGNNTTSFNNLKQVRSRLNSNSSYSFSNSIFSPNVSSMNETLVSSPAPFEEQFNLDLPYYRSTKYNATSWRHIHCSIYFLFFITFLIDFVLLILKKYNIYPKLISDISFFAYNFMNWFHFKRGCIGYSNRESYAKTNRDNSLKAKLLRSEYGFKYFFAIIACIILIYGDFYFILFSKKQNPDFWNINFVGLSIISLIQIFKIEKILTNNKLYNVKNDKSNCFVEIFLFFGSLIISASYLIQMMYYHKQETLLIFIMKGLGEFFICASFISLFYRYYLSGSEDLNDSRISDRTIID